MISGMRGCRGSKAESARLDEEGPPCQADSFRGITGTPTTAVLLLTGDNIIHTDGGDLLTKDAIVLRTTGAGDFAEVDTVIGGTGDWTGASGQFSATGTFTSAGGAGRYAGQVCVP